jgi:CHAD domain-containing protein
VGAVLALQDPALSGQVESVHDFRVASRSLRAALQTLTRRPDSRLVRKARRTLQLATRALADARDRDVGRSLLAKLPSTSPAESALKRRVLGLTESDRRVALARGATEWPKDLDRLLIKLLERPEPGVKVIIRHTRAEAWQQRSRAIRVLESLGRRYHPVRLHELRRRIRSLRYAVEVLAEVDSSAQARVIQLKPLQSALGDAQDRIVLSRWLGVQASRFRRTDLNLSLALRLQSAHFKAQSMQAHARFLGFRPKEVLDRLALHVDPTSEAQAPAKGRNQRRPRSTATTRAGKLGGPSAPRRRTPIVRP